MNRRRMTRATTVLIALFALGALRLVFSRRGHHRGSDAGDTPHREDRLGLLPAQV